MSRQNLSGAALNQWKRDREREASNELEALIDAGSSTPDEYFNGDVAKDNTTYNLTTRVLVAATSYIADLESNQAPAQAQAQAPTGSSARSNDPDIVTLRQAATRLIAKAEDKAVAARVAGGTGGLDAETREVLKKGADMIADLIDMIDQGGMSREQKRRWAREQESWGRRFDLQ